MFPPHTFLSCSSVDPPWPAASFRRKSPVWVLHRLQCLLGMSTCSSMGSSMGCSVDICFGVIFHGLQAGDLLHHGLQGGLCSGPWSTSSPPPFTSVLAPWLSLTFFPSLLTAMQHLCPLLNTVSLRCSPLGWGTQPGHLQPMHLFMWALTTVLSFKRTCHTLFTYFSLGNVSILQRNLTLKENLFTCPKLVPKSYDRVLFMRFKWDW